MTRGASAGAMYAAALIALLSAASSGAHGLQESQAGPAAESAGDAARGKVLFQKRCTGCHALGNNKQGPMLQGVYGRTSGTAAGYAYSEALRNAEIVWNDKSLNRWLGDPDQFVSGNNMDFLVPEPRERADLIAFLRRSSTRPRGKATD